LQAGDQPQSELLLRLGLGLFMVLLGAYEAVTLPSGHYLVAPFILLGLAGLYVLISAFVPWMRRPKRRNPN